MSHSPLDPTQSAAFDSDLASISHTSGVGPGAVVGRHVVLQKVGAGGMGVVYAAYDPELDRKVALKLLLPGTGSGTRRLRLLREAQALGRLSHPNVVTIHDVGTMGEQIWLAMEFVQGQTLGKWLDKPRNWRDVLEVLRKAGEGLAAAHAVGLLHRDFKPDNVMVGDDGRVRVMDFGLARAHAGDDSLGSDPPSPSVEPRSALATSLTRVGAVVGTPRYMAPEQFANAELTAAADQFSFCVTLWEALYGERPFAGREASEIVANVLAGRLRAPPKRRTIPGWLRRACERGLAISPAQRWPSMAALLDTLAKGRTRAGIRKGLAIAGVVALAAGGAEAQRRFAVARQVAECEAAGALLDDVWSPERAQALRKALVSTGVGHAPKTADKVSTWLDRQAAQWQEARVEVCLDAEVRDRWDADTLDRSLWCLDARRMELQALVEQLTLADAQVVQRAVAAASALAPVAACRDPEVLETMAPPPTVDREALRAVRADVVRAVNLERAGRYHQGLELSRAALVRAEALAWPPLVAEARLQLGSLLERSGAPAEAEAELERAYFEAAKGVAPDVAFDAACRLVRTVGVVEARHADGHRWARLADIALEDVPDGEHLRRASLLTNLGTLHRVTGDYDQAQALLEEAVSILERALGGEHLRVVASLINLSNVHASTSKDAEAAELLRRALAIQEQVLGPDNPDVAATLSNLGNVVAALGAHDEAKRLFLRAISIWERALGPEHLDVATGLNNLADEHVVTGDFAQALPLGERALAIWERALGPEHPNVGKALVNLAQVHQGTGDHEAARVLVERARAIFEKALGAEHPLVATSLVILGELALAQARPADAIAPAERALLLLEAASLPAPRLAQARFVLAQALWDAPADAGRDRTRARSLAEGVREDLRYTGEAESKDRTLVEQWLVEHPRAATTAPESAVVPAEAERPSSP